MKRLALTLAIATASAPASAAVFSVDTTADGMLSACTSAIQDCSLRGAILAANAAVGADRIEFDIPPTDPGFVTATAHWRIDAATALPVNEGDLEIDGYTQSGAVENTLAPDAGGSNAVLKIELRNVGPSDNDGLTSAGNNFFARWAVRGLAVSRFASQIVLVGGSAHRVEGCFLGTDISGTAPAASGNTGRGIGVRVQGSGPHVIGGEQPAARNLMSGLLSGVVNFQESNGLRIAGNLIGTNAAGTAAIANRDFGLNLASFANLLVGGALVASRNIISGNEFNAIRLGAGTNPGAFPNARVLGNHIGTDWTGQVAIPNGRNAASPSQPQPTIDVFGGGACAVQIGGYAAGEENLIANSGDEGVMVGNCSRVSVAANRFIDNRGLTIDNSVTSFGDGATANDVGDPDSGGNRLQNTPVAVDAVPAGTNAFLLSYRVDTAPGNGSYPIRVDFFRGRGSDVLERVASDTIALADAQTLRLVTLPLSALADSMLQMIATDADGNTSEVGRYALDAMFGDGFEPAP